jgi:HAD superfamily hydrolase (TIGR01509 family)
MIKAVIFDFFGVLALQGAGSFRRAFYPNDQARLAEHRKLQDEHHAGHMGYDDFIDGLAKLGGTDRETVLSYTENYSANIELLEYVKTLKPKYRLGIISNAGSDVVPRLLGREYSHLFDDVTLSFQAKLIKPQAEIYQLSAKNLGVITKECLFTDDISTYCEGAEKAGMKSIWYRSFNQFRTELEKQLAAGADY